MTRLKAIRGEFNLSRVDEIVADVVQSEIEEMEKLFERVTSGWTSTTSWRLGKARKGSDYVGTVQTTSIPFVFVELGNDSGTTAIMSPDWRARTSPGKLTSRGKVGRVLKVVNSSSPKKARDFRVEVAKQRKSRFESRMKTAMDKIARSTKGK